LICYDPGQERNDRNLNGEPDSHHTDCRPCLLLAYGHEREYGQRQRLYHRQEPLLPEGCGERCGDERKERYRQVE